MNKTADIEEAIRIELHDGPKTIQQLCDDLEGGYYVLAGQRQWIGVAMSHLGRSGEVRYPDCDHASHEGYCRVELVR